MKKQEKQQLGTECMWAFRPHSEVPRPTGCCGINTNALAWFQIVQWVLLTLGTSIPIIVVLLFWTTIPPPTDTDIGSGQNSTSNGYAHFSFHTHLTNGIIAVVDVWASAIPFRVYHFVYVSVFAGTYGLFTVIYFFAGGTGADGEPYIYGVLDYGSNPGLAVSLLLISILVISPIIHCLVYENYLMRQWLFSVFKALGNKRCKDGKHSESHEMVT